MQILYTAIVRIIEFIELAILVRVILSWVPNIRNGQFLRLLYQITEPVLAPIRSLIERSAIGRNSMIDFSPVLAFLLLDLIKSIIARSLHIGAWFI